MVDFLTIPDELLAAAEAAYHFHRLAGYAIEVEQREIGFPFTPALVCQRGHETLIVEVVAKLDKTRARRWVTYGRSQQKDTRVTFCAPRSRIDDASVFLATELRVGLLAVNGQSLSVANPTDLAVPVELPPMEDLPEQLWPYLGGIYQKFASADWRDALGDACQLIEGLSRTYLSDGVSTSRIKILDKNGVEKHFSAEQISKMTLGQLAVCFNRIANRNYKDSVLANILPTINPERVGLAHKRADPAVEVDVRKKAGNHMHAIIGCLEELTRP